MVVEVVLDLVGVDLGGEGQGAHKVLAQGVVGLGVLVEDAVDPLADAVEEADGLLDGLAEVLDVGDEGGGARLGVLCAGDGLEGAALGVAVLHLVGHLDEEAALGGALGVDGDGGADVAPRLDGPARVGGEGEVDGRVGEGARVGAGEEVLDEGAEGVELERGRVPAEEGLARVGLEGQGQHVLLVLDVDLDLVLLLGVGDGEARAHLDLGAILGARAHEGADDAGRLGGFADVAAGGMV